MRRKTLTEKILAVVAGGVGETAAFLYPYKGFGKSFKKYKGSFSRAIWELKQRGYLEEVENKGNKFLKITSKGRLKLIRKRIFKKWDGFWRIIAFDIEESRKKTRDVFRDKLQNLGCLPIQKSVWITPQDISADLEELFELLDIEKNVDYFISKALTNEEKYLEMFNLNDKK
ncbi:MAG: Transcriptional regulator, PaaX family [Berkelbacteria bacterium GW2011_GWB1_38_5]|uniref:Transcriptional regulator, PaaX family n=2 Tax=Candidatus Berkelbacteria TaxID=1618330 RepID=A0A0G0LSU1_9BACT|nr:MAG: Transcriptional regulator, PaaX family [Berkelbacteria bacterium GW2011_GWB1_38_5]KKQ91060.1 MAG: Transcriptional regulator, PaaX family [Berkelbacteria bacterium GW2011_GWA1_39_10]